MSGTESIHWDAEQYGKFNSLIRDYLNQSPETQKLYSRFPDAEALTKQSADKLKSYSNRQTLCRVLERQLDGLELTELQLENLKKLRQDNTLTITTGHQLNLFTGPVYIFYKILQVVKCCEYMNRAGNGFGYVPIFWMATEDHDFEEINHFYFKGRKFSWERPFGGAVGRMKLDGIDRVFDEFTELLPDSGRSDRLKELIRKSYLESETLTEANRKLIQLIFGRFGLLMLDGDDPELKELMIQAFESDLTDNTAFHLIGETNRYLEQHQYKIQVNPREINLFYLGDGNIRERIVCNDGSYSVLNTGFEFSREEMISELRNHPDKFSPNVILRPLFQETVLPNIAYIGGFGETAYWLQLRDFFTEMKVDYPLIIGRNSVLILSSVQRRKLERLSVDFSDLLLPLREIVNRNIAQNSSLKIDFEKYESELNRIFDELEEKAVATDPTFSKMVAAQRTKQLKGLDKMVKRLTRAERRYHSERAERIEEIYSELFPKNKLQERVVNFSEFQLEYGFDFINEVLDEIKPIDFCFTIKTFNI